MRLQETAEDVVSAVYNLGEKPMHMAHDGPACDRPPCLRTLSLHLLTMWMLLLRQISKTIPYSMANPNPHLTMTS